MDPAPSWRRAKAARDKGRLLHALLQHLPAAKPEARAAAGERFLGAEAPDLPAADRSTLLTQAIAALDHPACAPLFAPGSLAEVEIAATVPLSNGRTAEVAGRIDRLAVNADEVLFCDFKTGAPPRSLDATPRAYVTQAALYQAALASLLPQRPVRALLIWTEGPEIQELPPVMLKEALAALPAPP
jgi:ATP-dependent helicase/nuclease subunit A